MLPKPLYEIMPYIYLGLGTSLVISGENHFMFFGGCALFIAGAMIAFVRSEYRRIDENLVPVNKTIVLPDEVYQFLPYGYLLISLIIIRFSDDRFSHVAASLLISLGLFRLYQRYKNRHVKSMNYHIKSGHHALHSIHHENQHRHHVKHAKHHRT